VPDPTRLIDGFPPALWAILRRALARDPEDRQPTAAELARELDAFAGGTVDTPAVGEVMRELFTDERARQSAWLAEASAPGGPGVAEPLKSRSSFWATEELRPSVIPPGPAPAFLAPAPVAPSDPRDARTTARKLVPIVLVIAAVVATVVGIALALH
jgi:hypothetical protein